MFSAPAGGQGSPKKGSYLPLIYVWPLCVPESELTPTWPIFLPKLHPPSQGAGPGVGPGCVRAISPPDNRDREESLPQPRHPLSLGPFQPGFVVRTLLIHIALCFSKQGGKCHFFHEVPGLQGKCIYSMGGGEQW